MPILYPCPECGHDQSDHNVVICVGFTLLAQNNLARMYAPGRPAMKGNMSEKLKAIVLNDARCPTP